MHDPERYFPASTDEAARWRETRRRRRLLTGAWEPDLREALAQHLAPTREVNLGRPVLAVNLFKSVCSQLAVLYDRAPEVAVDGADREVEEEAAELYSDMGLWSIMQRHAEWVIGLRESLVLVGWSESMQRPTIELVTPDQVLVETRDGDRHAIIRIRHARRRATVRGGRQVEDVFWDVYDISDPRAPSFRIETTDGLDVTSTMAPLEAEAGYRWTYEGEPFLPWVLYHAADVGQLWDPCEWSELVDGTLHCGVLWSLFFHCCRDASWRQKYAINLTIAGGEMVDAGGGHTAQMVETSPSSVLMLHTRPGESGTAGTFDAPIEPAKFAQAVQDFQRTVVSHVGIHPADIERTEGASSGYAIQLRKSAQRRLGLKYEPQFRAGDEELLEVIAKTANLFGGRSLPVTGYSVTYRPIEETVDERMQELEYHQKLVDAGQLSRVDLYQAMHPGVSRDDAARALIEIDAINRGLTIHADRLIEALESPEEVDEEDVIETGEMGETDDATSEIEDDVLAEEAMNAE